MPDAQNKAGAGPEQQAALRTEYQESCQMIRTLTDVRFKLLTIIPIAAGAGIALKSGQNGATVLAISLFGFFVTLGLVIYNERNDQHYGELVGRAKKLEEALNLARGSFNTRPAAWLQVFGVIVNHDTGISFIYSASLGLWLYAVLSGLGPLINEVWIAHVAPWITWFQDPAQVWQIVALCSALICTILGVLLVKYRVEKLEENMRAAAVAAVNEAGKYLQESREENVPTELLLACDRMRLCKDDDRFLKTPSDNKIELSPAGESAKRLCENFGGQYKPAGQDDEPDDEITESNDNAAADLIAQLTGQSSRWIATVAKNSAGSAN